MKGDACGAGANDPILGGDSSVPFVSQAGAEAWLKGSVDGSSAGSGAGTGVESIGRATRRGGGAGRTQRPARCSA